MTLQEQSQSWIVLTATGPNKQMVRYPAHDHEWRLWPEPARIEISRNNEVVGLYPFGLWFLEIIEGEV